MENEEINANEEIKKINEKIELILKLLYDNILTENEKIKRLESKINELTKVK